jgi:hypothetical protein
LIYVRIRSIYLRRSEKVKVNTSTKFTFTFSSLLDIIIFSGNAKNQEGIMLVPLVEKQKRIRGQKIFLLVVIAGLLGLAFVGFDGSELTLLSEKTQRGLRYHSSILAFLFLVVGFGLGHSWRDRK